MFIYVYTYKIYVYIFYVYIYKKKVAFAEFYFLKRSFPISLFLNFQFLRPTVTCFVCLFVLFVCLLVFFK